MFLCSPVLIFSFCLLSVTLPIIFSRSVSAAFHHPSPISTNIHPPTPLSPFFLLSVLLFLSPITIFSASSTLSNALCLVPSPFSSYLLPLDPYYMVSFLYLPSFES
ncbi:hypothetical protein CHARACLAT_009400 [Characodon lateralis]|uniref:NADH dehydrogenase subunit 5 n=1 Tax=Characodon lateralis TaxID=208331 RepID=A0ABU7F1I6_9TELE|nr:hypothetical protein [Characodon lateralis]